MLNLRLVKNEKLVQCTTVYCMMPMMIITIFEHISQFLANLKLGITWLLEVQLRK